MHTLRFDNEEFAAIIRIKLKDSSAKIQDLHSNLKKNLEKLKVQLLEEDRAGASIYYISCRPPRDSADQNIFGFAGYVSQLFEVRDGKIKIVFYGEINQLKNLLQSIEQIGRPFKVVSVSDAKFSSESPLNKLTEKQRTVLVCSFEHGYFETPKKISNHRLAEKLNMKSATLIEHRRKAEQRILAEIIKNPIN
jgi:predicted DNA binding protein